MTAQATALLAAAIHDPLRATGSDGMVHLEYDLIVTNVFTAPVARTAIEIMTVDNASLIRLDGDCRGSMTRLEWPRFGSASTNETSHAERGRKEPLSVNNAPSRPHVVGIDSRGGSL